jgi:alpha-methylacyl-CoA racemase
MMTDDRALLHGIRVLELGGIGPGPHAGMLLAALGAEVIRIERVDGAREWDATRRGRILVRADIKDGGSAEQVRLLADLADVVIEGFRPGVAERLGLGAGELRGRNPRLVYAHMTGWGQHGPWAQRAGHDINYVGLTGALHAIGTDSPIPPLNLVGDFGGGSLYLALGVAAALVRRASTGAGCELDAAIVDGVCSLMQLIWSLDADGRWQDERGVNLLDGGMPYYRTYRCADGGWMAVGALEPGFYAELLAGLGLDPQDVPDRDDPLRRDELARTLAEAFAAHPRSHWERVFAGVDACATPVLSMSEAPQHPHLAARGSLYADADGVLAAAAPREAGAPPSYLDRSTDTTLDEALARWGSPGGRSAPSDE